MRHDDVILEKGAMSSITDAQRIKELQETAYRKVFACFIREDFALVCLSSRVRPLPSRGDGRRKK